MLKTADDLWDENSIYIDDDIDSLQGVAGSSVIKQKEFLKAIEEIRSQDIDTYVTELMNQNPVKFIQYALVVIGREIYQSKAADFKFIQESDLENGKRFKIEVKGKIKKIMP